MQGHYVGNYTYALHLIHVLHTKSYIHSINNTKTALILIGMALEYFEKPRKYTIVTTL